MSYRRIIPLDAFQLSPRIVLRPGEQFRATGGGAIYRGVDRVKTRIGSRGVFECRRIWRRGDRTFLDCVEILSDRNGGGYGRSYSFFIEGKPYRSRHCPGVVQHPYRIKKVAAAVAAR